MRAQTGRLHDWYRYLEANSDEEAAGVLKGHTFRLSEVYNDLCWELTQLAGTPSADLEEVLRVARCAVGEALDVLDEVAARFRAGEREIS